jgi:uncharacterized membrane protein
MTRHTAVLRVVVLITHGLLILAFPVWLGATGALLALPLVLAMPGLWRRRAYTYAWSSLLVLLYLGGLLMEAFASPANKYPALILAGVVVVEFCALVLYVRLHAAEQRAHATAVSSPSQQQKGI